MARGAEGQKGYECRVDNISQQCYSITKLIYFCVLRGLLYNTVDYRAGKEAARTTRGRAYHDTLARVCGCVMGVGHMMQRDVGHVCDETSGVGLGLSEHRDGFGTKHGMSHNSENHSC